MLADPSRPLIMIIVPAYNEGTVLKQTIEQLLLAGYPVVIVDDGSRDDTSSVKEIPLIYVRHAVNLGQGAALQTGMIYALRAGADIAVHFDADGQHDWRQIDRLVAPILDGCADVALGSRFLRAEDAAKVPWPKRIVLRGGILISWLLTGVRLSDTHNGFRALSRRDPRTYPAQGEWLCSRNRNPPTSSGCESSIRRSASYYMLLGILAAKGTAFVGFHQYSV